MLTSANGAPDPRDGASLPIPHPPTPAFDRSLVEGPLGPAIWRLAWPTMLTNILGGVQGFIDHVMVGHFVGFAANAAIGVANQIWVVVIVFMMSVFTGMSILVARFAGAGDKETVDRVVLQAFLVALGLCLFILAPVGYLTAPFALRFVRAGSAVQAQALPYLRILFLSSLPLLLFFLVSAALRSAGDARTPMRVGVAMTALNAVFNVILIRGAGPLPPLGTTGAALGTALASTLVAAYSLGKVWQGTWLVAFPRTGWRPDWPIIRALFQFGLPAGFQGIVMNVGGVLLVSFIGSLEKSAEAQAAYAVAYTQLFAFVTWTAAGMLGAAATLAGQNLGAGRPDRVERAVQLTARFSAGGAAVAGMVFFFFPETLLRLFGLGDPTVLALGTALLRILSLSGIFVSAALVYTGGLQGTGDTRGPLHISIVSQVIVPLGICSLLQASAALEPSDIWLAILAGHATRALLSMGRFHQGRWKGMVLTLQGGQPRKSGRSQHP